jgi:hypothetical protein
MFNYVLLLAFLISACSETSHQEKLGNGQLIFQSGFEPGSKVITRGSDADITGKDLSLPDHNDWERDFDENPVIGNFSLQYQGGDSSMRFARIIPEPGNPKNHVLHFWLNEPNVGGTKGRIQANIYGNNNLREIYQSVRVFLHPDFNTVRSYPKKITWLTIAEFWNNITWSQEVPYRFRITLGLGKPVETESDLFFILDAQDCELFADGGQKYTTIWSETNEKTKVPVGKWFKLDYYYKEGDETTGRFWLAITPDGEERKIIFDLTHITHNTTDPSPDGLGDFNPLKLYTSKDLIGFIKEQGKTLQIYWDDFRLWKEKRPE